MLQGSSQAELVVDQQTDTILSLGYSSDISRPGFLAGFRQNHLPVWYEAFRVKDARKWVINMNVPLTGEACSVP